MFVNDITYSNAQVTVSTKLLLLWGVRFTDANLNRAPTV